MRWPSVAQPSYGRTLWAAPGSRCAPGPHPSARPLPPRRTTAHPNLRWLVGARHVVPVCGFFPPMTLLPGRYDKRTAAAVAVMLTSPDRAFTTELALTENISDRGAPVLTKKVWWANETRRFNSLERDLQSEARVVYRQPVRENVYAIGLE